VRVYCDPNLYRADADAPCWLIVLVIVHEPWMTSAWAKTRTRDIGPRGFSGHYPDGRKRCRCENLPARLGKGYSKQGLATWPLSAAISAGTGSRQRMERGRVST